MNSSNDSIPEDWSRYRSYLRFLARSCVGQGLQAKVDPSDIVQQTLLDAYRAVDTFRGGSEPEMMAWLRRILQRNVAQAVRHFSRDKRDLNREQAVAAAFRGSALRLESFLQSQAPSPTDELVKQENLLQLCTAIEQLPADQRRAVSLHHLDSKPVSEVAEVMGRSVTAVAGLLKRGLRTLRESLPDREQ